jgi:hypothetical protein
MDLIDNLAAQLGVDPNQAQAVAGAVLGQVRSQVADSDEQAAAQLGAAVPELGDWQSQAASMLGGAGGNEALGNLLGGLSGSGGGGGGLLGNLAAAAGSGLGNDLVEAFAGEEAAQQAQVVALLGQLGIGADKATLVVPTLLDFLRERLGADLLEQVLKYAPMLAAAVGDGDDGGGLGGLVSGLFGS